MKPPNQPSLHHRLLLALGGAKLLIHLLLAGRYGYFRDELYFLDCGRHLDWGYVDHAPLIGLMAKCALLMGGALPALRIFPAGAGAIMVVLAGLIAYELGGGRFAQALAALCVIVAPNYLGLDSILTMNAFEPLFWMGCVYVVIRIINTGDRRLWMWFGVLAGLGLENKHSMLFFGAALFAGLLLTAQRREFTKPWIWIGAAIALVIFLPNLLWQIQHHFPTLEGLRNAARMGKNVVLGPIEFVSQQILLLHPVLLPIWLGGLIYLLAGQGGRYRMLGLTFVVFFVMMFALKAKNYYLMPIYPMLFAAGSVALESSLARWSVTSGRVWAKALIMGLIVLAGALTAPLALPVFSPEQYVMYAKALGVGAPKTEVGHRGPLPQLFGDQFGWPELVAEVARIYFSLPPEERAKTAIFASNFGEAGAIDHFGPRYGLPPAISAHQNYFYWGPREYRGDILIVLQSNRRSLERVCSSVEQVGEHFHPWGMAEENNPIFICRGLKTPLPELWPRLKKWN